MSTQQESYILTDPRTFESLDFALEVAARHPRVTYQTEECEGEVVIYTIGSTVRTLGPYVRLWRVVFVGPRCPICGLSEGTTHPGASDLRKSGGTEHICWKCAESYKRFIAT